MSQSSDRTEVSERPPPPNWILQHPTVGDRAPLCCVQRSGDISCSNLCLISVCQYQQMKDLQVGDSAQVHAAFLVYMDLAEGALDNTFNFIYVCVSTS